MAGMPLNGHLKHLINFNCLPPNSCLFGYVCPQIAQLQYVQKIQNFTDQISNLYHRKFHYGAYSHNQLVIMKKILFVLQVQYGIYHIWTKMEIFLALLWKIERSYKSAPKCSAINLNL